MSVNWNKICPHPSITVILGDIGSGKTGLACSIVDFYHKKNINCNVIADKQVHKIYQKTAPWLGQVHPEGLKVPNDSANLLDDAHLIVSARKWYEDQNQLIDNLDRESRHKNCSFVYTTQQSTVIDRNIVSMITCLIIKYPSILQRETERPFLRERMGEAIDAFDSLDIEDPEDYKKYSYVLTRHLPEPIMIKLDKLPEWFTDEISKSYQNVQLSQKPINIKRFFE